MGTASHQTGISSYEISDLEEQREIKEYEKLKDEDIESRRLRAFILKHLM